MGQNNLKLTELNFQEHNYKQSQQETDMSKIDIKIFWLIKA